MTRYKSTHTETPARPHYTRPTAADASWFAGPQRSGRARRVGSPRRTWRASVPDSAAITSPTSTRRIPCRCGAWRRPRGGSCCRKRRGRAGKLEVSTSGETPGPSPACATNHERRAAPASRRRYDTQFRSCGHLPREWRSSGESACPV